MDPSIGTGLATSFLKEGILGAIIVGLFVICWALWKAYTSSTEARIAESSANRDRYIALIEKMADAQKDTDAILLLVKDRMGNRRS